MKSLILTLVLASVAFSCKKSDPAVDPKVAIIGKWRITASSLVLGGVTLDVFAQTPACEKDNYTEFRNPNIAIEDEGATKCNASDPQQVRSGTWVLNADNTLLTLDGDAATVLELNNSTLRLRVTDAGIVGNVTYTKI